ncbi:MAG: hypothetical protein ACOYJI_05145 [Anaerovoracaceae bacterium]|jgi:hypothetical protein
MKKEPTEEEQEKIEIILDLLHDPKTYDWMLYQYFDIDSYEMLDDKIEVLTALNQGKQPDEIPKYYDVMEKFQNEETNGKEKVKIQWD